jgi:cellulose synthase/poly-beta-1,6-N-acetylglucosamine synthase-like glycosyltransferase
VTVDLLYVAHNRLAFTQTTFPALLANTNWDLVAKFHVLDDRSSDGTAGYLMSEASEFHGNTGQRLDCISDKFGGPVAAMNFAVDHAETDTLVKVDNDILLCPDWLDELLFVLDDYPHLDVLGMEAGFGGGVASPDASRSIVKARHVGGIGAIRTRIFGGKRPRAHGLNGMFGWTDFMRHHAVCGWLSPDLPCPLLDHLPFEPWTSLSAEYVARGWSRSWPQYDQGMAAYWEWAFAETTA